MADSGAVGCTLAFEVTSPATIVVQVAVADRPGVGLSERLDVVNNSVPVTARELVEPGGTRQHLIRAQPGALTVTYQATVTRTGDPVAEEVTDPARIAGLRPSRYCPSDRIAGFAGSHFGELPGELDRVRAICDYVWAHVGYATEVSGPSTDAVETLLSARGVCRDFAHLVAALCRAVDVPARIAAVYAPGLAPMDFHAIVETAIDGFWWAWDATRLAPRPTLVRIVTGRDAADVAFATVLAGRAELSGLEITAVAAGDLPFDGHDQLVALR
jgi:transglutaminase-like putative cysteine protease